MDINHEYKFIETNDDIARLINDRANHLYKKLATLDLSDVDMDETAKQYFIRHHCGHRSFFSVQSSAHIIYGAVIKSGRKIEETSFLDYGAGLGTLFLLAGLVGFKQVYFNDYFPQWANYAKAVCDKLDISMAGYITGGIDAVIEYAKNNNISMDIIASRNVVEHIYKLRNFYTDLYRSGITVLCYSTTTANFHNPAMRLKHYFHHRKVDNTWYKRFRREYIQELVPAIHTADLDKLVKITRGRAFEDFTGAVDLYFKKKPIPAVEFLGSNTCDCRTGVWAENLIRRKDYFDIITTSGFKAEYTAGFWDTNYKYKVVNLITRVLNRIIKIAGKKGYWFSPFVNIIACKTND